MHVNKVSQSDAPKKLTRDLSTMVWFEALANSDTNQMTANRIGGI